MTPRTKPFAKTLTALSAVVLACAASSAQAVGFASPSGNIRCYLDVYSDVPFDEKLLVCLVFDADWDLPPYGGGYDPGCDLDSTRTVTLPHNAPATAEWTCHGDVFWPAPLGTISYGSEWSLLGFICDMATTGVTCLNEAGHTVSINRAGVQN